MAVINLPSLYMVKLYGLYLSSSNCTGQNGLRVELKLSEPEEENCWRL